MISHFRNFAKSPWALGLIGLIMLSFVIVGTQLDVFGSLGPRHVITAGQRSMTPQEFVAEFTRVRDSYQEQGQTVTFEEMVDAGVHQRFLEERATQLGFLDWAHGAGVRPSNELVLKRIRETPAFFNPLTNAFDPESYAMTLQRVGATPQIYEAFLRDSLVEVHYRSAMAAGLHAPRVFGALAANQGLETRDARWFAVTQTMAGEAPAPTDEQLTAFLNENADRLRRPELRTLSVVLFTNEGDRAAVTDAQIQEAFEFRRESLSVPEKRSFVLLSASDRATADRIAAALRDGKTPEQAGALAGVQPTPYNDTVRSAVADPAVAEAVFGLAAPGVTTPVQARVGFAVTVVQSITPGREASLADARDDIVAELASQAANKRVSDFMEAQQQGQTLAQAAAAVGARIITVGPVSQDGATAQGRMNLPPQLLTTAWSLQSGEDSDVIDAGGGQYFALRVDNITPAALPELAQVREPLAAQWRARENSRRLNAYAEGLSSRVRAGEDLAAVAASARAALVTRAGLGQNAETQEAIGEGVLRGVFGQDRGQIFSQPGEGGVVVIGRVDAVHAPVAAEVAPIAEQIRPRLAEGLVTGLLETNLVAARDRRKARYDLNEAIRALGITPPAAPAR